MYGDMHLYNKMNGQLKGILESQESKVSKIVFTSIKCSLENKFIFTDLNCFLDEDNIVDIVISIADTTACVI